MPTQESVLENLKAIDIDPRILPKKELAVLPQILADDEHIHYAVQGIYSNGFGLLCATNRRVVFIDKGIFFGITIKEIPLKSISSISVDSGILTSTIKIFASGTSENISSVHKIVAERFRASVAELLNPPQAAQPSPSAPSDDRLGQLERLASLFEKGILNEDEFKVEKAKLLQ